MYALSLPKLLLLLLLLPAHGGPRSAVRAETAGAGARTARASCHQSLQALKYFTTVHGGMPRVRATCGAALTAILR